MNMTNYCPFIADVKQHALIQPQLINLNFASDLILSPQPINTINIIGSYDFLPNITDRRNSRDAMQPYLHKSNYNQTHLLNILANRSID